MQEAPTTLPLVFRVETGCSYRVEVHGRNAVGEGPDGSSVDLTAVTSATAPRSFAVEFPFGKGAAGKWGVIARWDLPVDPGDTLEVSKDRTARLAQTTDQLDGDEAYYRLIKYYRFDVASNASFAAETIVHTADISSGLNYSLAVAEFLQTEHQPIYMRIAAHNAMGRGDYAFFELAPTVTISQNVALDFFDAATGMSKSTFNFIVACLGYAGGPN